MCRTGRSIYKTLPLSCLLIFSQLCQVRGWLCKRGVKGFTGRRWRRRWFSTDKNGRLYYYQKNNNTLPRGYVAGYLVTPGKLVEQGPFAVNHNSSLHNLYRKWVPSL